MWKLKSIIFYKFKITVNIIDGNQDQVEIIKHKCKGQTEDDDGIKINHITSEEFLK